MTFDAPDTTSKTATSQDTALRTLCAVARHGVTSRETITKVLALCMSSDHVIRRATISALLQINGPDAERMLIGFLQDPNANIQSEAADALGQLQATSAVQALNDLLNHTHEGVALRAARALGRMNDASGLSVAIRCLRKDSPLTRLAAHTFGCIVGQPFRPNSAGVAQARHYLKRGVR